MPNNTVEIVKDWMAARAHPVLERFWSSNWYSSMQVQDFRSDWEDELKTFCKRAGVEILGIKKGMPQFDGNPLRYALEITVPTQGHVDAFKAAQTQLQPGPFRRALAHTPHRFVTVLKTASPQ